VGQEVELYPLAQDAHNSPPKSDAGLIGAPFQSVLPIINDFARGAQFIT